QRRQSVGGTRGTTVVMRPVSPLPPSQLVQFTSGFRRVFSILLAHKSVSPDVQKHVSPQEGIPLFNNLVACVGLVFFLSVAANSQTKLLRFPDIKGDRVVFTYGGDLWSAPSSGGSGWRLASHPGGELCGD